MKVTTIRFGDDLWALLEAEATAAGVSVSQYIREAALARAAFAAGARADVPGTVLAQWAAATIGGDADPDAKRAAAERLVTALRGAIGRHPVDDAEATIRASRETVEGTAALLGEARQTARRSAELRRRPEE